MKKIIRRMKALMKIYKAISHITIGWEDIVNSADHIMPYNVRVRNYGHGNDIVEITVLALSQEQFDRKYKISEDFRGMSYENKDA